MKVYLCGGINGLNDADCRDWREYTKENLLCETLDPMRRDYRGREMDPGIAEEIVANDESDLQECDIVLANCAKPSWGTAMEIRAAHKEFGKTVVAVLPEGVVPSPWLVMHSDIILRSMADGVKWINKRVR